MLKNAKEFNLLIFFFNKDNFSTFEHQFFNQKSPHWYGIKSTNFSIK
jgi:hypothetical protein